MKIGKYNMYECRNCKRQQLKKGYKRKTIEGFFVYVCLKCGYYNGPHIFDKPIKK